jgi:hypothetical protein
VSIRRLTSVAAIFVALHCAPSPSAPAISNDLIRCGVLEDQHIPGEPCVLFVAGSFAAPLDNYGGFVDGDTVLVYGTEDYPSPLGCGGYGNGIRVRLIQECHNFDFGCGTLYEFDVDTGPSCFYSRQYGYFDVDRSGAFGVGDTVRVFGRLRFTCISFCEGPCIVVDSIAACDSLTAVEPSTWGRLKALFR